MPPASFRFLLAVDTLAVGYTIPAIRAHVQNPVFEKLKKLSYLS